MRLITLLLAASLAYAQNPYGRITGHITDSAGAHIPNATLTILNTQTNARAAATTNATGVFDVPNLNPGIYRLTVQLTGFKTYNRGPIELRIGEVLNVDVPLELGNLSESVTVESQASQLEESTASLGQVVDNRRIQELPLPGQNPMYLTLMTPGVITTNAATHGWLPLATDAISNIASNGARTGTNEFSLDGLPNMSRSGQISFSPPPETVQEFKVETATYSATSGHFMGANINMVLKSGTNQLHGVLNYSYYNRALSSVPFFANKSIYDLSTGPVTQDKINKYFPGATTERYRASMSGPLVIPKLYDGRNRTFWMFGWDRIDRVLPQQNILTVPTAAEHGGDFSQLLALNSSYQIYDPNTTRALADGRFQRDPIPGNILPKSRIDPIAAKIVAKYGLPNTTGTTDGRSNFNDANPRNLNFRSFTSRADQILSDTNRLYGSYTHSTHLEQYDRSFSPDLTRGQEFNRFHDAVALHQILTLRPNLIADLSYGVTRFKYYQRPYTLGFDLTTLGINSALVSQLDKTYTAFPDVQVDGYTELSTGSGNFWATNTHSALANVSYIRGSHTFQFGAQLRSVLSTGNTWGNISPLYVASTTYTKGPFNTSGASAIGQGLASLLLGIPTGGSVSNNASYADHSNYIAGFVHDDWKLSRTVTLNMGLRYELETPVTERFNRSNVGYDFSSANPIQSAAAAKYALNPIPEVSAANFKTTGGLLFANQGGVQRGLYGINANLFSPRLGLAWRVLPTMVIRGGYGIFYDSIGADQNDVTQQGFSQSTDLTPSLDNGLTYRATLANPFPSGLVSSAGSSAGLKTFLGRSITFYDPNRHAGHMQRWSINIQKQLPNRILIDIGYTGSKANGLTVSQGLDPTPAQFLSTSFFRDQPVIDALAKTYANPFLGMPEFAGSGLTGNTVARSQLLRPYPQFTGLTGSYGDGWSAYNSLPFRIEKRFTHGYTAQATYTWSKLLLAADKLNNTDTVLNKVIAGQDRTHQFVATGIYEIPVGKGRRYLATAPKFVDYILGGWQVEAMWTKASGPSLDWGNVAFYGVYSNIAIPNNEKTPTHWFNTDAGFEKSTAKQLASNVRFFPTRTSGARSDGTDNWNLSTMKNFRITERLRFQLRAEAQDALNHAMFAAPNTDPTSSLFGQVSATQFSEQRRLNLIGRLDW